MPNIVLTAFFKKYRDAIQSNTEFRTELDKQTNHYFVENIDNLKSQIALVDEKREREFNKKYAQALSVLKEKGMSNLTFSKISSNLREKFLDHFQDLKAIGVDTGHVVSNLTLASKSKAQTVLFEGTNLEIKEFREIETLSDVDLRDIAKTIALISSYTETLEMLDAISNKKDLLAFLNKSKIFRQSKFSAPIRTLEDIKREIQTAFTPKSGKGINELTAQIFRDSIANIEVDTTINMARKITANSKNVAVTFEIRAVNAFKGNISQGIKTVFTSILDSMLRDPKGLPKDIDEALEKAVVTSFTKTDLLSLFPNVSASKTPVEAIRDIIQEILTTGKSNPYASSSKTPNSKINTKSKLKIPSIKLKQIKVTTPSIRTQQGQFYSLASLQVLLNANLQHVIAANMGDGAEKRILNYRTGRFAASVSVSKLTQSRKGMITAFYSYMKNPYQTFEPGFKQGSPKTRNPKLLIAKSIREIAATKVGNRMRSVSI